MNRQTAFTCNPMAIPVSCIPPSLPQKLFNLLKTNRKPVVLVIPSVSFTPRGFGWAWNNYQEFYMPERSAMPVYGNVVRFHKEANGLYPMPAYFQTKLAVNDLSGKAVNVRREEDGNGFTANSASLNYLTRPFTQKRGS